MRWVPVKDIRVSGAISQLNYSNEGLLACTSWDGSLYVSGGPLTAVARFSRPLTACAWTGSSLLWVGGGEGILSQAQIGNNCSVTDRFEAGNPVLSLAAYGSSVVCSTAKTINLYDPRSQQPSPLNLSSGAVSLDILGTLVCTASHGSSNVYDLRNQSHALHTHTLLNTQPLQVKWLDNDAYAVSDNESHVSVVSLKSDSYVFKTNRFGPHLQPRPVYSLATRDSILATGGGDNHVYIWDWKTRKLQTKIGFPMASTALAYGPEGQMAVGLSNDEFSTTQAKFQQPCKAKVMVSINDGSSIPS